MDLDQWYRGRLVRDERCPQNGSDVMIQLTTFDRIPIDMPKANIREVQSLGDGAIVYQKAGPPIRVVQSVSWIVARWKQSRG